MRLALRAAPVVLLLLLQAAPAGAHAAYERSTPGDGQTVSSPPSQVEAEFSEPVTSDSFLEVTDPCGNVVSGSSRPVADRITVSTSGTRAGTYTVFFRVQSTIDSHVTEGTFSFTSSGGEPCPGEEPRGGGGGGDNDPEQPPGGGGDDPSDPGTGSDPDDPGAQTTDQGSGTTTSTGTSTGGGGNGGGGGGNNGGNQGNGSANNGGGGNGNVRLALEEERRREPSPWDLPTDGLIWALAIAALIGAAGGKIYASIMGPRA